MQKRSVPIALELEDATSLPLAHDQAYRTKKPAIPDARLPIHFWYLTSSLHMIIASRTEFPFSHAADQSPHPEEKSWRQSQGTALEERDQGVHRSRARRGTTTLQNRIPTCLQRMSLLSHLRNEPQNCGLCSVSGPHDAISLQNISCDSS